MNKENQHLAAISEGVSVPLDHDDARRDELGRRIAMSRKVQSPQLPSLVEGRCICPHDELKLTEPQF